ncbi:MAG: transposase [Methanomicrobiales archaeon]|nr:transposase [Methanomicrobiales archaeon]
MRPTKAQEAALTTWLAQCCDLYNGALHERRDAWRKLGKGVTLYDQFKSLTEVRRTVPGWDEVPCEVARSALRRLDLAMKAFFRRCKAGETPGFPRFRSKRRYDSFGFGTNPVVIQGDRVVLPKLGYVKFHLYRPLKGKILYAVVRREAGKWVVVFQCDIGEAPAKMPIESIPEERVAGVDLGLTTLATLSQGKPIENPRHGAKAAEVLARRQRALARKRKGSKSRHRALVQVQEAYAHVANQRLDTARKAAVRLCRDFDLICFEDLNIRGLAGGMLAKPIHDAAWRLLIHCTSCKAESAGKHVVEKDARRSSIDCSGCGARVEKTLRDRTHSCPVCGLVLDRDLNAALNMKNRALGRSAVRPPATPLVTAEGSTSAGP